MAPVVELDNLEVTLGTKVVLSGLRCSLSARTIGLLGPNGAGKSTLIQTLLGFHPASAGTARVLGNDIRAQARAVRASIGYMPENDAFIAGMSAVSFVRLMAEVSGLPPRAALERAHEVLFYVGLGEARYRRLETYSLGMKQLAKLAQAIVHSPQLLILDEPTNGLDPPARLRMIKLIRDVRESGNLHLILCSHLLRDVEETCEEVLILKDGLIVHQANLEEERRANRKFIEMEASGADGNFSDALAGLGCEFAVSTVAGTGYKRYRLVLTNGVEVRDLYRLAAERQVQIRRLNFKRDSLEEIFLKAMGITNGAHAPAASVAPATGEANRGGL